MANYNTVQPEVNPLQYQPLIQALGFENGEWELPPGTNDIEIDAEHKYSQKLIDAITPGPGDLVYFQTVTIHFTGEYLGELKRAGKNWIVVANVGLIATTGEVTKMVKENWYDHIELFSAGGRAVLLSPDTITAMTIVGQTDKIFAKYTEKSARD